MGGNLDLRPEESKGYELGVESWNERMWLGITHFHQDFDTLIEYYIDPTTFQGTYKNIGKAQVRGLEMGVSIKPVRELQLRIDYTSTQTKDKETGRQLLRRPRNKYACSLSYTFPKAQLNLKVVYTGSYKDFPYLSLPGYTKVDLAASYNLTPKLQLFGRINNLLDEDYEEVKGYGTPGFSCYGGIRVSL